MLKYLKLKGKHDESTQYRVLNSIGSNLINVKQPNLLYRTPLQ